MHNKRGYEFGFAWIFAIIVGAVIIFIAIYATTKLVDTQRTQTDTVRAKEVGVLVTPVELGIEQSKLATIVVPDETRLINNCSTQGTFGRQYISAYVHSGVGKPWQPDPGVQSTFRNKYIFSEGELRSEEYLYLFAKPFKFPFKIADIIMVWPDTENYCFVFSSNSGTQRRVNEELTDLNLTNVDEVTDLNSCPSGSKTVCFDTPSCDINIKSSENKVEKDSATLYYVESLDSDDRYALLYAAVFSDPDVYDCQISRIAERATHLSELYTAKSNYLTPKGCSSAPVLPQALNSYSQAFSTISYSSQLAGVADVATFLKQKNDELWPCKVF